MDYLLPSDETMKKMAAEYSRMLSDVDKKAAALTCSAPVGKDGETMLCGCLSGAQPVSYTHLTLPTMEAV